MKSGRQRRVEITARRAERAKEARAEAERKHDAELLAALGPGIPVDPAQLAPYNSYGAPEYVFRGFYIDVPFRCRDCGVEEVWAASQQKWWYEVAKGNVWSRAVRCRACRVKRRGVRQGVPGAAGGERG